MWPYVGLPVAFIAVAAFIVLWISDAESRPLVDGRDVLYAIGILICYWPDPTRFSLGWYTIRVFAVLSSGLVLIVLLYEITTLYSRLIGAIRALNCEREARLMTGDAVAATIAHEVKQPLSGMITSADAGLRFLGRATPAVNEAKEAFRHIFADGHRAGAVIGSVRTIFRNEDRNRAPLDLNELISETLALVREDLKKHRILVDAKLDGHLPHVTGYRIELQQVLVNLIANAIDSMSAISGSRILSVKFGVHDNGDVRVSVADTGTGISSQNIDRIFNPLFTTKSGGMGMGLSICRSIIEAHEGRLWVSRTRRRASSFILAQFALPRRRDRCSHE